MREFACAGVLLLLLGGCASSSYNIYSRDDVGRVIETTSGTVVSARPVNIKGERTGLGVAAGGATGAVIGTTAFSGSGGTIAGVLMGLAGAVAGALAEEMLTSGSGVEYTIQTDDGRVVTVVQNDGGSEEPIVSGTPVLVQWGADYARVIPENVTPPTGMTGGPDGPDATGAPGMGGAPMEAPARSTDDWVNPDLAPSPGQVSGTSPADATTSATPASARDARSLNRRELGGAPRPYERDEPAPTNTPTF